MQKEKVFINIYFFIKNQFGKEKENAKNKFFQLRYLQTLNSISAENNSTIIFPVPIDMISNMMSPSPPSRLPQVTSLFIFSDDNFILTSNQIIKYRRKNIFQCSDSIKCFITNKKLRLRHNIPYKKGLLLVPFNYPCLSLIK